MRVRTPANTRWRRLYGKRPRARKVGGSEVPGVHCVLTHLVLLCKGGGGGVSRREHDEAANTPEDISVEF